MSSYVDFRELKEKVSIEQVVAMLDLKLRKSGGQLRGRCPIHNGTTDREFVVTPAKGLFYCFGPCGGGDLIALVAKVKDIPVRQAATLIAGHFGIGPPAMPAARGPGSGNGSNRSPQPTGQQQGIGDDPAGDPEAGAGEGAAPAAAVLRPLQPLTYLEAEHELVQALGVSPETARHFGAGYAPKGIMRGRLAIPIRAADGMLLAYCGRAVRDEEPKLIFPKTFDPAAVIFNADRIDAGELHLVRDPLQVLTAHESGVDNVVAVLTDTIAAGQLQLLAELMNEKACPCIELF